MRLLPKSYFKKDALTVAKNLLGKIISYNGCSGMIVETEAYKSDPASHAYKITPRSRIMLESYGKWYVYFIYGMYHCLNITTNENDIGAVLIRALQPISGTSKMKKRRKTDNIKNLCSGPGKLCQAFNITKKQNNTNVNQTIKIYNNPIKPKITKTNRIGIKEENPLPWRFYIKESEWVSRK